MHDTSKIEGPMMETIIPPVLNSSLCDDIESLHAENHLISRGAFDVFVAKSCSIPNVLQEIGRLREMTFRSVGEGTGKAVDIDPFDSHYDNLFIWDRKNQQIVGGYRIGMGQSILEERGIEHFYINTLFEIHPDFHPMLKRSIELGRSYIVPAYQKGYLPFFLLWSGILEVLMRNPSYEYLIGPVSISKYYSGTSKSLIVEFVKQHFFDRKIAAYFSPRTPFQAALKQVNMNKMLDLVKGNRLKDLETFLSTIEPEHIKVPVLLKQYTKLNAKFISFNLDPNFSDALDGLMILDLKKLPPEIIQLLKEK